MDNKIFFSFSNFFFFSKWDTPQTIVNNDLPKLTFLLI